MTDIFTIDKMLKNNDLKIKIELLNSCVCILNLKVYFCNRF